MIEITDFLGAGYNIINIEPLSNANLVLQKRIMSNDGKVKYIITIDCYTLIGIGVKYQANVTFYRGEDTFWLSTTAKDGDTPESIEKLFQEFWKVNKFDIDPLNN